MIGALLLAAGSGNRMQGEVQDKLLHPIGHTNAFTLTCQSFLKAKEIESLVIAFRNTDQLAKLKNCLEEVTSQLSAISRVDVKWVQGGKERQDSVLAGLQIFDDSVSHVLVHDCARPFIRTETISLTAREVSNGKAIAVARPLRDTLRQRLDRCPNPIQPGNTCTLDRAKYWVMETPQGAPKEWLQKGLEKSQEIGVHLTDEMAAIELLCHPVGMLEVDYPNPKITTPHDFSYAEFLLQL